MGFVNFEGCITAKVMVAALERAGKEPGRDTLVTTLRVLKGVDMGGLQISFNDHNHQGGRRNLAP